MPRSKELTPPDEELTGGLTDTSLHPAESSLNTGCRLILRNFLSPGDIVMLTAAVRDLHACYPGCYVTDVRTPCPQLWENNPYISSLDDDDPTVTTIACEYPLIHSSNTAPWHFVHAFMHFLSNRLGINIRPTAFRGDIHLSSEETSWISQVQEITGDQLPFWIINAGGKEDFTIKWWSQSRYQAVVDHFRGKILFVQVGASNHRHPQLKGVLDLRGKTDLRQLIRLVYHAQGVLCPVTLLMHLAAAVRSPAEAPRNRPCVVVAGGREPSHWEAYPHHQFIHTNGALFCCDNGGCWKSRTFPLGDGDEKDFAGNLCSDVVLPSNPLLSQRARSALAYSPDLWSTLLPRCMHMVTAADVIRRIEVYFEGNALSYLDAKEAEICNTTVHNATWGTFKGRIPR